MLAPRVCVLAPSPLLTVAFEASDGPGDAEIHLHPGGQGFWIARLIGELGVDVVLCATFGGETGHVVRGLLEREPVTLRAIGTAAVNGCYVDDRRTGERVRLATMGPGALSRHEIDELYGAVLVDGLDSTVTVLGGPGLPEPILPAEVYRRLAADLVANGRVVVADLSGEPLAAVVDVTVAAPGWDSSGASASLTGVEEDGRLLFRRHRLDGAGDLDAFGVEAAPAFIVRAAIHGAFGEPPDLVVSGVNNGMNTGHAVLHSGTVGAALTASTYDRPAAAFSIGAAVEPHWETAADIARAVVRWLVEAERPIVLNVNVPNLPLDEVRGLVPARLAAFGAVQTNLTETGEGYVKFEYRNLEADHEPGTDSAALADGFACFTPLSAVCEHEGADTTGLDAVLTNWG